MYIRLKFTSKRSCCKIVKSKEGKVLIEDLREAITIEQNYYQLAMYNFFQVQVGFS
jgi:hypothetical protein